ncbi:glycosyltransferase family 2 protein [Chloroflexota bacterium]
MTDVKPRVVAVIPCYNTAPHIAEVVNKTRQYVDEVIVVDDGSTDDTAEIAKKAGAKVVRHDRNLGYGEAIKTCFREAHKNGNDVLVTIDGDGQHSPEDIPKLIKYLNKNGSDLVIGSRFLPGSETNIPKYRKFGIGIITLIWNLGSKVKVSDSQSGFRAYRKKMLDGIKLRSRGMSISIEILERSRLFGYGIGEVPISCKYDHKNIDIRALYHGFTVALSTIWIRSRSALIR